MKTRFVAFILILFACVLSGCQTKLTNKEKLAIAHEVMNDPQLLDEYNKTYSENDAKNPGYSKKNTNSQLTADTITCTVGKLIQWDSAKAKITTYSKNLAHIFDPVYVEFEYTCLKNFTDILMSREYLDFDSDDKIRVYFSEEKIGDNYYESMVLVPAISEPKHPEIFTDTPFVRNDTEFVYDLGSPCPPGCESGRKPALNSTQQDKNKGANMARAAYRTLPCCLERVKCPRCEN